MTSCLRFSLPFRYVALLCASAASVFARSSSPGPAGYDWSSISVALAGAIVIAIWLREIFRSSSSSASASSDDRPESNKKKPS